MVSFKIDKQLQTISNYFLLSLAVADLIIGAFSVPLFTVTFIMDKWPFSSHLCDAWLAIDYLASNASVWNLMMISIDRYFSVTRPLSYRAQRTTMKVIYHKHKQAEKTYQLRYVLISVDYRLLMTLDVPW